LNFYSIPVKHILKFGSETWTQDDRCKRSAEAPEVRISKYRWLHIHG